MNPCLQELDAADPYWSPSGVIRQAISSYIQTGALSVAQRCALDQEETSGDNRCRNAARILRWLADNPKASPTEPMAQELFIHRQRHIITSMTRRQPVP